MSKIKGQNEQQANPVTEEAGAATTMPEAEITQMVESVPNFDKFMAKEGMEVNVATDVNTHIDITKIPTEDITPMKHNLAKIEHIAEELDEKKIFDFTNNNQAIPETAKDFLERIKLIEEFNKQSPSDQHEIISKLHEIQIDQPLEHDKIPEVIEFIANEKYTYTEGLDLVNKKTQNQNSVDKLSKTRVLDHNPKDLAEGIKVKEFNSPEERKIEVKQLQEKLVAINEFEKNSEQDKRQIAAKLYGNEFNEEPNPEDVNKIINVLDLRKKSIVKNLEAIDPKGYISPSQNKYNAELKAINEEEKQLNDEIRRLNLHEERNQLDQGIFDRNKKYQGHTLEDYNTKLKTIDEELKQIENLEKSIRDVETYKKINQDLAELEKQEQQLVQESIDVNSIILKKHELNQLNQGLAELDKQDHQISKELQEINSAILKNDHPKPNELYKGDKKLEDNLAGNYQNAKQQPSENIEANTHENPKGMWRRFIDSFKKSPPETSAANNENHEVNLHNQAGKGSRNLIKKISGSKLGENIQNLRNKFRRFAGKIDSAATPDHAPETPHAEHHNNKITH